jgi:transaldolase
MELFVDSADPLDVKASIDLGAIEGITTTPTFMKRMGITDIDGAIIELSHLTNQLHIEALGETWEDIVSEAERQADLSGLGCPVVAKVPITREGLRATNHLVSNGYKVNVHLVYTLNQAYMAAAAGASYICPLVGRLHDQGHDSFELISQIVEMIDRYGYDSKVMVSSVRHPEHVRQSILHGAHACTVPWAVMRGLSDNVLTTLGVEQFVTDTRLITWTANQLTRGANPVVSVGSSLSEAAVEMTKSGLGAVTVVADGGELVGIVTDGDIRRGLDRKNLAAEKVESVMTEDPVTIEGDSLLADAVAIMRKRKFDNLVVVDGGGRPVGMLDIQDLLDKGLFS